MAEQLQIEPSKVVFAGNLTDSNSNHKLTNNGATRIMIKVNTSAGEIIAHPEVTIIEPNETVNLLLSTRYPESNTKIKMRHFVYVLYMDAPAGLQKELQEMRQAWKGVKGNKSIRMDVDFPDAPKS